MTNKIIKIIDRVIEGLIYLIVAIIPLYFAILYRDFSVFSLDKTVVFCLGVEAIIVFWVLRIIIARKLSFYAHKTSLVVLPFIIFYIIACLVSIDPGVSFWGSYWRQQGLFVYLHYFMFFLVLISSIREKQKIIRIGRVIIFSSLLVSIYGIVQWVGLDFLPWNYTIPVGGRVTSTFGQPVFLSNYLVLTIFLTLYYIVNSLRKIRFIYITIFILQFFCLYITYTRGAWLAFIFGTMLLLYYRFFKDQPKRSFLIKIITPIIVLSSLAILIMNLIPQEAYERGVYKSPLLRIRNALDLNTGSLAMRKRYWQAGVDLAAQKPIIGYGPESQHSLLVRYYKPDWSVYEKINTSPDRVHNELIDILVNGGFLLFFSYLSIIGIILYKGGQYLKKIKNPEKSVFFYIYVGFISYQIAIFSSFSSIETNVFFWLYLSWIFLILNSFKEKSLVIFNNIGKRFNIYLFLLFFILVIGIGFLARLNVNQVRADYFFRKAKISFSENRYPDMFDDYSRVLDLNPYEAYYKWFFIFDALQTLPHIDSLEYRLEVIDLVDQAYSEYESQNDNYDKLFIKGSINTAKGQYVDALYYKKADEIYDQLVKLSPYMPNSYKQWGDMLRQSGDNDRAIAAYNQGLSVLPSIENKYLNQEHRGQIKAFMLGLYHSLAKTYHTQGDIANAKQYYLKILKINPMLTHVYLFLGELYEDNQDYKEAKWYYSRGAGLEPNNDIWAKRLFELEKNLNYKLGPKGILYPRGY